MFSTLDILLTNREKMGSDLTEEWEFELARQEKPKLKFPLKVIEADLDKVELGFIDPVIKEPKKKKEDIEKSLPFKIKEDSIDGLSESIEKIENQMYKYAKEMEFEKAAQCRDKMKFLKRKLIDL